LLDDLGGGEDEGDGYEPLVKNQRPVGKDTELLDAITQSEVEKATPKKAPETLPVKEKRKLGLSDLAGLLQQISEDDAKQPGDTATQEVSQKKEKEEDAINQIEDILIVLNNLPQATTEAIKADPRLPGKLETKRAVVERIRRRGGKLVSFLSDQDEFSDSDRKELWEGIDYLTSEKLRSADSDGWARTKENLLSKYELPVEETVSELTKLFTEGIVAKQQLEGDLVYGKTNPTLVEYLDQIKSYVRFGQYKSGWGAAKSACMKAEIDANSFERMNEIEKKRNKLKDRIFPKENKVAVEKEGKAGEGVVWYEGMKEDLEELTRPDENLSKEGYQKRIQIVEKLKRKGINNLPKMSTEIPGSHAYACREQFQSAVEYLNPLFTGKYRREAIGFLNNLGIGNNNGVPFLPGSAEAKEKEKEGVVPESNEDEKRSLIESRLIRLSETKDEMLKKQLLEMLEVDGIRIKQLLEEVRITKPEWFDNLDWLLSVVKWWKMDETGKQKYPDMQKLADYVAGRLGL